ncbi:unnamed protein product [Cuscuta campestris]|uniref:Putative plant transposon protein domain-containing protein n=1 Tax=Cuscuta campestris TaxID=132261 RepID=A0A484NAA5_9ASTE|nr:unnamed protein product [Cuscuta campestris]
MRAFLKSQGGGVWRTLETGWTEPVKYSDDLTTSTIKKFEDYSRTEVLAAEHNDKALNAIFGAVNATQYRLISNCISAKEAWDILEVTYEGRLQEPFPESKLVLKVLRSLPEKFDMDVKAISQSHDAKKMTLNALMGNLVIIELNMKEDSKRRKPEKQTAFLGTDLEGDGEDALSFDEEFQEQLPYSQSSSRRSGFKRRERTQVKKDLLRHPHSGSHVSKKENLMITVPSTKAHSALNVVDTGISRLSVQTTLKRKDKHSQLPGVTRILTKIKEKWTELLLVNRRNIAEKNQLTLDLKVQKQNLEKVEIENADLKFELQKLKDYIKWMKIAGAEVLDAQELMFKAPGDRQGIGCDVNTKIDDPPRKANLMKTTLKGRTSLDPPDGLSDRPRRLRNLDVPDFSKKTNLLSILHSNKLFKSVTLPGSFVKRVIQEFYINLSESCVDVDDPSYHKVFVRGRLYDFSPSVINNFLGTTSNPAITLIAEETVWNDLTNGLRDYQHGKTKVPSSVLKSSYALLLRIAAFHWLPTTHTNTVPLCMATLLYIIKNHAPLDLERTVFDQVMSFATAKFKKNKNGLPYPLLVYSILRDQGFEKEENEEEEPIPSLLQVDSRHLEGSHFNDMVDTGASGGTAQDPFSVEIHLNFLDKEIKALQMDADYHQEIAQRSTERRNMLIHIAHTLRQTRGAQRQGEPNQAQSSCCTSRFRGRKPRRQ